MTTRFETAITNRAAAAIAAAAGRPGPAASTARRLDRQHDRPRATALRTPPAPRPGRLEPGR